MAIVRIFATTAGDPYMTATIDRSAIPAALWRCVVGGRVAWEDVKCVACEDDPRTRHAAAVISVGPGQVFDAVRHCAAGDTEALDLEILEVEATDYDDARTLVAILDGRALSKNDIVDLVDSIANGTVVIV